MTGTDVMQQLIQMFNMMLLGSSIMFIFDLTSEIVRQAGWRRLKHMAADFITTMFCGCVFCVLLIDHNHGLIRSYVLAGLIVGVAVYRVVLKNFSRKLCRYIAGVVLWCGRIVKKIFLAPWRWLICLLIYPVKQKITAARQLRKEKMQNGDELEEII